MALTETAQRNHDRLLPGRISTLAVTDPEFIELFDNFTFGEVFEQGPLDWHTRLMVLLASLIATQSHKEYRVMLGAALDSGVTPVEAKEILYQSVAYVGSRKPSTSSPSPTR